MISTITGIPKDVLLDYEQGRVLDPHEKLEWMSGREATREEDLSYSLLGILDVTMTPRYGEGRQKARERLLAKVSKNSTSPAVKNQQPERSSHLRAKNSGRI